MDDNGRFGFDPDDFDRVFRDASEGLRDAFEGVSRFFIPGDRADQPYLLVITQGRLAQPAAPGHVLDHQGCHADSVTHLKRLKSNVALSGREGAAAIRAAVRAELAAGAVDDRLTTRPRPLRHGPTPAIPAHTARHSGTLVPETGPVAHVPHVGVPGRSGFVWTTPGRDRGWACRR